MRDLSEAEAWREIAERIGSGVWRHSGLCDEVDGLLFGGWYYSKDDLCGETGGANRFGGLIDRTLHETMRARVRGHMTVMEAPHAQYSGHVYAAWKFGESDVRVLAALFLALEAEDEAQSVAASLGILVYCSARER